MIWYFLVLVISAVLFAKLEIEIEGSDGWAKNLPTKKFSVGHFVSRFFFGGRPATMYHAYAMLFIFVIAHFVYAVTAFSWKMEALIIAFICIFWILEDFFWFAFNPAFGIRNFKKEKIWWHAKQWWGIAPREYFIFSAVAASLLVFAFS